MVRHKARTKQHKRNIDYLRDVTPQMVAEAR